MNIFKVIFKKGDKGDAGDAGINYELPTGSIIAYDDTDTPEGYEETSAPAGTGDTIEITVTENGTYYAADYGAEAFSKVTVSL